MAVQIFQKIRLACDGSVSSAHAMNLALALGAVHHAKVLALYVNDPYPNIGVGSVNPMGYSACMDSVKKRASEIHQQFTQAAHTLAPSLPIECLLLEDTAVSECIVQTSQDQLRFGATTAHAPPTLFRRAGAPFVAAGCSGGTGRRPNRRRGQGTARASRRVRKGG